MSYHPNFPPSLSISPNTTADRVDDEFGISAQRDAIETFGIAGRVWEAALAMCSYIDSMNVDAHDLEFDPPFFDDGSQDYGCPTLIELGSGTGIVAARIARAFLSDGVVIATDLPDVCPLLERNLHAHTGSLLTPDLSKSGCGNMFVRPLSWGNLDHAMLIEREFGFPRSCNRLTHVICSDLVYFPELFAPLLRTLIHLTSSPYSDAVNRTYARIVVSYKVRSLQKETPFWAAFGLWFAFHPVLFRHRRPLRLSVVADDHVLGEDQTFVFVAHRRPESMSWEIPQSDQDLIDGVGARGTSLRKADDTFETLLFMAMEHVE
ncbi:putative methyltransferase-domain-containing protein [Pisolithus orientalis]|uniref:putative methyltransferase-domain-containing protein n=1 Tax=Pisolithus orientalis TaxID=936130 RepID=UPI002223F00A|nr:putative methyltransferase-domain-containing protein [Pisolithus orientalis]KAI6006608.1 putative methyltransferase-domain-containing protein [Pisolithus orientalis]